MLRRAIVLVTLAAAPMIAAPPSAEAACTGRWSELPSPASRGPEGIAAFAEDDAWVVAFGTNAQDENQGYSYHWDGLAWTKVAVAEPGVSEYVWGIGAIDPDHIWIVGDWQDSTTYASHAYAAYWDGSQFVHTPMDAGRAPRLFDADGVAGDDVWAVGFHFADHRHRSLAMHWDGVSWTEVALPGPSLPWTYLHDVSAFASDDVWAVGYVEGRRQGRRPLAMHWDGVTWTRTRPVAPRGSLFDGVAATAPNDVWAVGYSDAGALLERWDGTAWRAFPVPAAGSSSWLGGVSAVSHHEAWAVGGSAGSGPLLYRWNGSIWRSVTVPGAPVHGNLFQVVSRPDGTSFAIGWSGGEILALQRCPAV
jgi:hypothetical protein